MLSLWIIFALLAAFFVALVNIIDRLIIKEEMKDSKLAVIIGSVSAFVCYLIIGLIYGISFPSWNIVGLSLIVGILNVYANVLYYNALKKEEVSRVVPVMATIPIFVLILAAIFLGEKFVPLQYLGILFLVIGAFLISFREKLHHIVLSKVFGTILFASFLIAIISVISKYVLTPENILHILFWFGTGGLICALLVFAKHHPHIRENAKKGIIYLVFGSMLAVGASFLLFYSIAHGPVSLVLSLYESKPLFVFLMVLLLSKTYPKLLREKMSKRIIIQKLLAVILIVAGSVLLI
ncbi:hypothetical protein COU54_00775 [Candidatus Pacearchaeota archaeon CG10_big_fil_rev_8_21_14_0_10_31_24]|nr:MAG: hypothetical protein COU54_00775 [Candidatus Pacearchaeota archaeon CG10_big_fil_rev_8_21_14_0_10_31_24]